MSDRSIDENQIIFDINQKLGCLPSKCPWPSIIKVDNDLRGDARDIVYDPEIVAIGPYHHGKSHLLNMEKLKRRYLERLLKRRNEDQDRYITAMLAIEEKARECYYEPIDHIDSNEFLQIMVLDGCFLIELFRNNCFKELRDEDDPIFNNERTMSQIRHDIFLLENQLPFFILSQLFNMTKSQDPEDDIICLTLRFVGDMFLNLRVPKILDEIPITKNVDHILGLIHLFWCLPFAQSIGKDGKAASDFSGNINPVSDLREAGIKFERAKENKCLLDIKFLNGVLRIPQLSIFDETESRLRNLIVYEQYLRDGEPRYVSDYTFLFYRLINTSYDVELLRRYGIIENYVGDDKMVCQMFNRLVKNIPTPLHFSYSRVFHDVNEVCCHPHSKLKAHVRRNYFSSSWSAISLVVAVLILFLSLVRTIYTSLPC